MQLTIVVFEFY